MSLFLALACAGLALPQESAVQKAPAAHAWWEQLDPQQRERMQERWSEFQRYSPESREEMRQRHEALEGERSIAFRRLHEEERARFEGMNDVERRRFLDERVRERSHGRCEKWQGRFGDKLSDLSPEESRRRMERFAREAHGDRAQRDLDQAVEDGWLGPAAANWLRGAPPEQMFEAIGQVHRWRFYERADREGFWERHQIGPEERSRMLELPVPHFFEEVNRLERGEPLLRPPSDWRGRGPPPPFPHERPQR